MEPVRDLLVVEHGEVVVTEGKLSYVVVVVLTIISRLMISSSHLTLR